MRAETVQYDASNLRVVQWARWAGVGLLFWVAGLAIDNFDLYTSEDGGFWVLLWVMLPYVALASVLVFSQARLDPPGYAPMLVAGAVAVASLALALRVLTIEDPLMGPIVEPGVWSAVEVLANIGLPLAVLLYFLTAPYQTAGRLLPLIVVAVGLAVTVGAWVVSVRDLSDMFEAGTWVTLQAYLPSNAFGFLLIVAGVYAWGFEQGATGRTDPRGRAGCRCRRDGDELGNLRVHAQRLAAGDQPGDSCELRPGFAGVRRAALAQRGVCMRLRLPGSGVGRGGRERN